jgi:hypothetical protein
MKLKLSLKFGAVNLHARRISAPLHKRTRNVHTIAIEWWKDTAVAFMVDLADKSSSIVAPYWGTTPSKRGKSS